MADLRGRLFPASLQHPHADRHDQRQASLPGVGEPSDSGSGRRRRGILWATCNAADHRGCGGNPVNIPGSTSGSPRLSGSILQVNGILYVTSPDNAWAMDALDGHVLWHYWWKSRGATHIGNRGMAMHGDWLYFETPDDYLVSLEAKTGQERWHKEIAAFSQQYFSTMAPVVVGNHVLVGTGDDLDSPGFLQSFDPKTGNLQWKFYTVPMKQGDPGLETWA